MHCSLTTVPVALRKESVDRNGVPVVGCPQGRWVALRKESVDRNINCNSNFTQKKHVALRKESVDRNIEFRKLLHPS